MSTQKLYIKEDITDWQDETLSNKTIFKTRDDVIKWGASGLHTAILARSAIVSRELGKAPDDLVRPNRSLLIAGASEDIAKMLKSEKVEIQTESGKTYSLSAFVGQVQEPWEDGDDDDKQPPPSEPSYIAYDDPAALVRAEKYMHSIIPGHVFSRLKIIYANGGDISGAVEDLKEGLDEMVTRFD